MASNSPPSLFKRLIDRYSEAILTYMPMYDTFKLFYFFQWFITNLLETRPKT